MKKKYFFIFLILLVAGKAFSFQKGIISVDKSEVRSFPASNSGKVVKTLKAEDEIIIYDTKGTNTIDLPLGLEIGLSKETVINILGVPSKEKNDSLLYEVKNTYIKLIEFNFQFENNLLIKIFFRQEF